VIGLGTILGWISPLKGIAREIARVTIAKQDAQTEQARIEADIELGQLKAREAVLIAEQSHALTRWVRPAFAYPCAFYWAKIWVWDKALGWGATDAIDNRLWWISMTIIGAYFLTRPFEKAFRRR